MFVFDTDQIPATSAQLTADITSSLRRKIKLPLGASPVAVAGELPNLASLAVDVSDGVIDTNQPLPDPTVPQNAEPGPTAASLVIRGHPITIEEVALEFDLSASDVVFAYARNDRQELIATLRDAAHGHLSVRIDHEHLEQAILFVAKKVAASSGVAIQKVSASLTSVNPTTVDVLLNVTAKKLVTAMLRISGRLSVDDRLTASATNLNAQGDGMVGGIAANFIRPHLQQLNGQPLPLLAFSLGNVRLRGIKVQTDDGVQIAADFGSAPP